MFSHLLVPLDGSKLAEEALPAAISLAEKYGSQITLLHVLVNIPQPAIQTENDASHDELFDRIHKEASRAGHKYLSEQVAEVDRPDIEINSLVVGGNSAAEAILSSATLNGADAIIMSTHGRSGINRWMFGSVAEKVLRGANLPVLLLPAGTEIN